MNISDLSRQSVEFNPFAEEGALSRKVTQVLADRPIAILPVESPRIFTASVVRASDIFPKFKNIDSSKLETIKTDQKIACRRDFLNSGLEFSPPQIGKSDFVSIEMAEHLMRDKKDRALGVKYKKGDSITNMEGALHTFVTPVCRIFMTGDYKWFGNAGGLQGQAFGENRVREVILSAAIHPDFEDNDVIMPLVQVRNQKIVGEDLNLDRIPSASEKSSDPFRKSYEEKLLKHMIYHLSPDHKLPALCEISKAMTPPQTKKVLEQLIQNPQEGRVLQNQFMKTQDGSVLSLEILFQIYVQQLRNEFKVLNAHTPQGYVYTISPPSIFAQMFNGGDATILNRLQALAFQSLASENLFSGMQVLGFSDYADKGIVSLLQTALPHVKVISQNQLFDSKGGYAGPKGLALVVHNNSDAFGQNIETEGATSLDGVIGYFSNAACTLKRDRSDLLSSLKPLIF